VVGLTGVFRGGGGLPLACAGSDNQDMGTARIFAVDALMGIVSFSGLRCERG